MFREEKNLKDSSTDNLGLAIKDSLLVISYSKTNKLITALYMVTDIIDKDEPLRNKLRTLGAGIISDMNSSPVNALNKISETLSFLDIASAINIISAMNGNILKNEFLALDKAIKEALGGTRVIDRKINLSEFFIEELTGAREEQKESQNKPIGHPSFARIGVQKGSTLMKALRKIDVSDRKPSINNAESFNILKKQRRGEIVNFIQKNGGGATITDIKNASLGSLASCGEKTLQRELVSMIKDGVLKKTGEKRWSKYALSTKAL